MTDWAAMDWNDVAVRVALGALVGFGFVSPTASAVLSLVGVGSRTAVVAGGLVGLVAFAWVVYAGERVD